MKLVRPERVRDMGDNSPGIANRKLEKRWCFSRRPMIIRLTAKLLELCA